MPTISSQDVEFLPVGAGGVPSTVQCEERRTIWVEHYGLAEGGTGAQNATAFDSAIAALPPGGGTLKIGPGTFVVDQIRLPVDPKVVNVQGAGIRATVFVMGTPAGPLIRRNASSYAGGRITGSKIGNFTVQANATSEKTDLSHRAISFTGFGKSLFHDIAYKANGTASVGCMFEAESSTGPSYNNVLERIEVMVTTGPSRVLRLHNAGQGSLANPNLTEFRDSFVYACSGVDVVAEALDSTRTKIDNVLFEDCPGAAGVGLGQNTIVTACWFELLATNIYTAAQASVDGSSSLIFGNYFSGAGTSFIDTINVRPLWFGNAGGGQQVTGAGVIRIGPRGSVPPAPTLAQTEGTTPTTGPTIIATAPPEVDHVSGRVVYAVRAQITPAAVGYAQFMITPPAGYVIETSTLAATRNGNGKPAPSAEQAAAQGGIHTIYFEGTDPHDIFGRVVLRDQ